MCVRCTLCLKGQHAMLSNFHKPIPFFAAHTCRAFWPLRTRMLQDEVNQIGMALKAGTMTPDEVDERLAELEMLDLVYPELMGCEQ
jgi:hypothetical protein